MNRHAAYSLISVLTIVLIISGCITIPHNIYSSHRHPKSLKEEVEEEIRYISTSDERDALGALDDEEGIRTFREAFWERRNPAPGLNPNPLREEYGRRLAFANASLGGSHSDRGRIYLIYGPPDDRIIDRLADVRLGAFEEFDDMEVWVYFRAGSSARFPSMFDDLSPGMVKFVFADLKGFGYLEQIYSTEDGEKVDPRVFVKK